MSTELKQVGVVVSSEGPGGVGGEVRVDFGFVEVGMVTQTLANRVGIVAVWGIERHHFSRGERQAIVIETEDGADLAKQMDTPIPASANVDVLLWPKIVPRQPGTHGQPILLREHVFELLGGDVPASKPGAVPLIGMHKGDASAAPTLRCSSEIEAEEQVEPPIRDRWGCVSGAGLGLATLQVLGEPGRIDVGPVGQIPNP